jgi:hypothetical protein
MLNLGENWSFDMSSEFSFLFFSFLVLFFFIINCIRLFLILERVAYDTCDSRVTNIICNFLNCFIFLNIFCIVLFYLIFLKVLKKTKTQI